MLSMIRRDQIAELLKLPIEERRSLVQLLQVSISEEET